MTEPRAEFVITSAADSMRWIDGLRPPRSPQTEVPESTYPGITIHLRNCGPCAEDFQGLLAAAGPADVHRHPPTLPRPAPT